MTKRITALVLALTAAAILLTGCELRLGPDEGPIDIPTMPVLSAEDMALLSKLNEDGDENALNGALAGLLPPGYTLAADEAPVSQPGMLPDGEAADKAEVMRLVQKVQDIFNSGTFHLEGRGNNMMDNGGGAYAPINLAVDQDKMMMETNMDWSSMMKMAFKEQGKTDVGQSKIQASIAQTTLGKKMRMLFVDNTAYMVYPDKNLSMNLSTLAGEDDDFSGLSREMVGMFDQFGAEKFPLDNLKATQVKQDKNTYLCASVTVNDTDDAGKVLGVSTMKYYFLKGNLKRLEVSYAPAGGGEKTNNVIEIDTFTGKVDASLFSTKGYREMNVGDMTSLTGMLSF